MESLFLKPSNSWASQQLDSKDASLRCFTVILPLISGNPNFLNQFSFSLEVWKLRLHCIIVICHDHAPYQDLNPWPSIQQSDVLPMGSRVIILFCYISCLCIMRIPVLLCETIKSHMWVVIVSNVSQLLCNAMSYL